MMEFVEPEDEPGRFSRPLPPDDRLWRHPSEVGASAAPARAGEPGELPRPSIWMVAAVSAVSAGLIASGLVLVLVGIIGTDEAIPVVERQMEPRPIDAVASDDVVDVAAMTRPAVVQLRLESSSTASGSGVIFRSDGHLLTSASVLGTASVVRAVLEGGRELVGRVVGTDPDTDTAVVKLDGEGPFPVAVMGTSSDLRVGQQAIAVGWHGAAPGGASVTVGVISGLHRTIDAGEGRALFDMVQTDTRVPFGWPGGALVDSAGSVIGITSAAGATLTGSGGFGFSVPIDVAHSVADQLIAHGRVIAVWLGVKGGDLDPRTAAALGLDGGALVGEVKVDSPAQRVGISAQDVIVGIDGVAITTMGQLVVALRRHRPGDTVQLEVVRDGGRRLFLPVVLEERPAAT